MWGQCGNYLDGIGINGVEYAYIDVEEEMKALIASRAGSKCPFPKNVADALACKSEIYESTLQYWIGNLVAVIDGADMIFIIAGMGGDTGSAIAPAVGKLAWDKDILAMAFAVLPFEDEGMYQRVIEQDLDDLCQHVDSLMAISNQQELEWLGASTTHAEVFLKVNDIVKNSIQGIADLITYLGMICIDFADVKAVIIKIGEALMSTATAMGQNRAKRAVENALFGSRLNSEIMHEAGGCW